MKRCHVELIAKNYMDMLAALYPEKTWDVHVGCEEFVVVSFEVDGMGIEDPTTSDCGRFEYDVKEAMQEYKCSEELYFVLPQVNKYLRMLQE